MDFAGTYGEFDLPLSQGVSVSSECEYPVWRDWVERLPDRPLSADVFSDGMLRRQRETALRYMNIEINPPGRVAWLGFDIDRADAFDAAEDAGLPQPNVTIVNPSNGHAHMLYALRTPVGLTGRSREAPKRLLQDVERGMIQQLGADPSYIGRIAKNPLHDRWRTRWLSPWPFELKELREQVELDRKAKPIERPELIGHSRNVELFDCVRAFAYQHVVSFKKTGGDLNAWVSRLIDVAIAWNAEFSIPLPFSEVRSVTRSVAKWTWRHFTEERFSRIQSTRAGRRGQSTLKIIQEVSEAWSSLDPSTITSSTASAVYPDMAMTYQSHLQETGVQV